MAPPLLQLKEIALTFGGTPLLTGAELSVSTGERVSLVGRNGSGKSTLLKIAAGLVEPDRGSVFVQPGTLLRYLPQEPDFSGFRHHARLCRSGAAAGRRCARGAHLCWSELGLTGAEDPAHLSGGEARRASLARVLAPSPDILLLDEPTNHLDLTTIEWLERELDGRRTALVIISHDRRFLSTLSRVDGLARPRRDPPDRARLCPFRGMARHACWPKRSASSTSSTARSSPRSTGCATASPRGASATCAGSVSCRRCASSAAPIAPPPADASITAGAAAPSGKLVIEAEAHRQELRRPRRSSATSRSASSAATASASSGRTAAARPR